MRKRLKYGVGAIVGFLLSPLSWWNDLLVNVPIAYGFAWLFGLLFKPLFLPLFFVGYILTNILGLVMLHHGMRGVWKKDILDVKKLIWLAIAYTILVVALVVFGVMRMP
jgi:hypothetical protein